MIRGIVELTDEVIDRGRQRGRAAVFSHRVGLIEHQRHIKRRAPDRSRIANQDWRRCYQFQKKRLPGYRSCNGYALISRRIGVLNEAECWRDSSTAQGLHIRIERVGRDLLGNRVSLAQGTHSFQRSGVYCSGKSALKRVGDAEVYRESRK